MQLCNILQLSGLWYSMILLFNILQILFPTISYWVAIVIKRINNFHSAIQPNYKLIGSKTPLHELIIWMAVHLGKDNNEYLAQKESPVVLDKIAPLPDISTELRVRPTDIVCPRTQTIKQPTRVASNMQTSHASHALPFTFGLLKISLQTEKKNF